VFLNLYSVACIKDDGTLVFYVDNGPMRKWKSDLIGTLTTSEEQVRFKIESEESKDVATPWKANKSVERRDLSYHGPYGVELFSLGRIYALSFFLGGIGITGGSQMIFDCIEHFPQAKVYIFWSIKETDYLELTLFKGNFILI
jgi:hypothetical protein